jgi:DNA adenine methylase
MQPNKPSLLVEPFAGGASVSLSALKSGLVERVKISETDPGVAAFWKTVLQRNGHVLAERILNFSPTKKNVLRIIDDRPYGRTDLAFKTLIKNRFSFGGILADGAGLPRKGELDKGLTQRWYPETIAYRILYIHSIREQITFTDGCGLDLLRSVKRHNRSVCFIDPPYLQDGRNAGKRIYRKKNLCIHDLIQRLTEFNPKFLLTYHQSPAVASRSIAAGLDISLVPMKSSHHLVHHEMVITNDPAWELVATWTDK